MSEFDLDPDESLPFTKTTDDLTQLWVVSYSDFMTILMIFFLMLFAHRVWEKKVSWEERRVQQLRAAQEAQGGMVQRLSKLASIDVKAERIDIQLPDALLFHVRPCGSAGVRQRPAGENRAGAGPFQRRYHGRRAYR